MTRGRSWASGLGQPSVAAMLCVWLALVASADDVGALRALDDGSPYVEFVDPGRAAITPQDLEAAFARVLRGLPSRVPVGARPEDAAVGRISAVHVELDARGAPRLAYHDAHGVVLADFGCAFAFATVAHFLFDVENGTERVPRSSVELAVAGRSYSGAAIHAVLPSQPPSIASNRTLRDIVLLLVTKAAPCERLPVMPLFSPAPSAAQPPGWVISMCPRVAPQPCGLVILPSPTDDAKLPLASAMAYHSCTGRRGDSGCPLIAIAADGSHRLLALQTQGVPIPPNGAYARAAELRYASRAALLGERVEFWVRKLAQLAPQLPETVTP